MSLKEQCVLGMVPMEFLKPSVSEVLKARQPLGAGIHSETVLQTLVCEWITNSLLLVKQAQTSQLTLGVLSKSSSINFSELVVFFLIFSEPFCPTKISQSVLCEMFVTQTIGNKG